MLLTKWKSQDTVFFSENATNSKVLRNFDKFFSSLNPRWTWRLKLSLHNDPSENLLYNFSSPSYSTLDTFENDENSTKSWKFFNFCRSIAWRQKIIQKVLKGPCKEETSIFKFTIEFSHGKKTFQRLNLQHFGGRTVSLLSHLPPDIKTHFCEGWIQDCESRSFVLWHLNSSPRAFFLWNCNISNIVNFSKHW